MTKGIRAYTNERFAKFLSQVQAGELTGRDFRAKVMDGVVSKFEISVQAAATHYNHALKTFRAIDPESVAGLGRPEDKKGGRPVLHPVTVINARTGKVVADGVSLAAGKDMVVNGGLLVNGSYRLAIKAGAAFAAAA